MSQYHLSLVYTNFTFTSSPLTTPVQEILPCDGLSVKFELTSDDLEKIDSSAVRIKVEGARYPEKLEALTGR